MSPAGPYTATEPLLTPAEIERAAVVAWLRRRAGNKFGGNWLGFGLAAKAIERGDHLPPPLPEYKDQEDET